MGEASDNQSLVVDFLALKSHTGATHTRELGDTLGVEAQVDLATGGGRETQGLGIRLGAVVDVARSWVDVVVVRGVVVALEEGELAEEVGRVVRIGQRKLLGSNITSQGQGSSADGNERRGHFERY